MTSEACRSCKSLCHDCPRPRLLPDVVDQVLAYLACRTQWRVAPSGGRLGMDYTACRAVLEIQHPTARPSRLRRLFTGVQEVEQALLTVQHENHEANAANGGGE